LTRIFVVFLIALLSCAVATGLKLNREPDFWNDRTRVSPLGITFSKMGRSSGQQARIMALLSCLDATFTSQLEPE
jgi:hypothetical protein